MTSQPVVLITGASRGLGRAIASTFAAHRYAVGINYRQNEQEAQKTADLASQQGALTLLLKADVSESTEVQAMIKRVMDKWGRLDVLVNNAGLVKNQLISKMTDQEWSDVMAVNLNAVFYSTRAVIPFMREQNGGSIINITSFIANKGIRGAANYAVSKAGVITLTKNTALEEGKFNIRANAIMPGFHVTDMNEDVWKRFEGDIRSQHLLTDLPKREEMSEFVVKISELKSVTGQVFSFESRIG